MSALRVGILTLMHHDQSVPLMIILLDAVRVIRNSFYQSYISVHRSRLHVSSINPSDPLLYVTMSGDTGSRKKRKLTNNLESVEKKLELL